MCKAGRRLHGASPQPNGRIGCACRRPTTVYRGWESPLTWVIIDRQFLNSMLSVIQYSTLVIWSFEEMESSSVSEATGKFASLRRFLLLVAVYWPPKIRNRIVFLVNLPLYTSRWTELPPTSLHALAWLETEANQNSDKRSKRSHSNCSCSTMLGETVSTTVDPAIYGRSGDLHKHLEGVQKQYDTDEKREFYAQVMGDGTFGMVWHLVIEQCPHLSARHLQHSLWQVGWYQSQRRRCLRQGLGTNDRLHVQSRHQTLAG